MEPGTRSKFHPKQETTKLSCSYLSEAREELEAQQEESGEEVGSFLKPGPPAEPGAAAGPGVCLAAKFLEVTLALRFGAAS